VAERLLSNWESEARYFVKIMPTDYKRVLEAAAAARASGRDEVVAIMASTGT
jgi:glutamate synthase (NADPH/NADH) large chain